MQIARPAVALLAALSLCAAAPALAQIEFVAKVQPRQEVPAVSSFAGGTFTATMNEDRTEIEYQLFYNHTDGQVTQSHIHFAQPGVNGGIVVFLCSNLGNGPEGTQPCPTFGGTIQGTIDAGDVGAGAASQGLPANNMFELTRAMIQGVTYVNVHTDHFPGGELRGHIVKAAAAAGEAPPAE